MVRATFSNASDFTSRMMSAEECALSGLGLLLQYMNGRADHFSDGEVDDLRDGLYYSLCEKVHGDKGHVVSQRGEELSVWSCLRKLLVRLWCLFPKLNLSKAHIHPLLEIYL